MEEKYNREELYTKQVTLYLEANPNPNSMKFVANFMLLEPGESHDYPCIEVASNSGLAKELFKLPFVERVFFMSNFVTVTKNTDLDWIEIQEPIKKIIKDWIGAEKPIVEEQTALSEEVAEDSADVSKIKMILEEYIKPAVEQDGGAITFHSFENGTVKVLLQGSCSGCPSSTVTLKSGIENVLKRMVPSVKYVEAEGV